MILSSSILLYFEMPMRYWMKNCKCFFKKITIIKRVKKMINVTEFVAHSLLQSRTVRGERLSVRPKAQMRVPFFKWGTFSAPTPKLNMTLYACLTHITQSNNKLLNMPKWKDKINCVLWNVSIITSNLAISSSVFHSLLMLLVIWLLILLMSWCYRQCVLLCCGQFCFGGEAMFTNYQT